MRVLHFAETLIGGPATHLNQLLPHQANAYSSVSVFCPQRHAHLIQIPSVNVISFPDTDRSVSGLLALAGHWREFVEQNSYDIIHLHSSFAGAIGRTFPIRSKTPIVYCARGWSFAIDTSEHKRRIYQLLERLLSHRADAIINISQNEAALAIEAGISTERCHVVYNGIADAEWSPLAQGSKPKKLLFVGRFDRQKGVDLLLEAMNTLSAQGYKLDMIGEAVVGQHAIGSIPSSVTKLGWRNAAEVQIAMNAADVIMVPSRWEGFGFVAAEAMRAGRPLLASNVGGLSEIIVDGETGVLCAPNSTAAIIEGVNRIAKMDTRQLGVNGRARFEKLFTAERMFREIDTIYTDLRH